jgi:NitT/TauT family transport system substrate-binding protein
VAQEKGFFKEEGLEISVKYSGNDDQVFATVLKGEAMFGIGDPIFTAVAREQGAKGKVVASIVSGVSIWGLTNKDMPEIEKAEDFSNLKIGTFPAPSTVYTLVKSTISNPDVKKADIVQAPIGSQVALLEKGLVDVAMEIEPSVSIAESQGYKVVYSASKFYGAFAFTGVTTTEDNIAKNKETIQKFVNAIEKSVTYIQNSPEGAIEIAQILFPTMEKEVVAKAVTRMIEDKAIPVHAAISDEGWQYAMKIRQQIGDLKEIKPTADAVDNSFAKNAVR